MSLNIVEQAYLDKPYTKKLNSERLAKLLGISVKDVVTFRANRNKQFTHNPKILILDIETAPLKAYVWSRWKQNIYLEQTISE